MKKLFSTVFLSLTLIGCATMSPPDLTKLNIYDTKEGSGKEAVTGKPAVVHYSGWLYDASKPDYKGKPFDSSRTRNSPFTFTPGQGQVIKGWEEGVTGMKVGGQRTLIIPPDKGYGARGVGPIPPNSVLVFDVELVDVR